mgnify:CR=1 FL=1
MVRWNSFRFARDIASLVGVELEDRRRGAAYNGRAVVCTEPRSPIAIHDIAHFQCAVKWRRGVENFALGPSPFDPTPMPRSHLSSTFLPWESLLEDLCACALTSVYFHLMGMYGVRVRRGEENRFASIGFAQEQLRAGWVAFERTDEYLACVAWLKSERLLDVNGYPTFEGRKSNDETFRLFGPFRETGMIPEFFMQRFIGDNLDRQIYG